MADGHCNETAIQAALAKLPDPETGQSLTETGQICTTELSDGRLSVTVALTTHSAPLWEETRQTVGSVLAERFPELSSIDVELAIHRRPPEKLGELGLSIKSVVAVGSGKGGVGKSTIAASIAYGLSRAGCQVGLMDADVYGPSIPHLLGVDERPTATDRVLNPVVADDIKVMSMGFLVPPGEAIVWRGPMLHGAITQFLRDTDWGELDYLIIDMPPGTGDIALTLSQLLPLSGAMVVCTPQDVAWLDAVKAIAMFRKVNIPVLGVVENMSYFQCPGCDKQYDIFGSGGAARWTEELGVPLLGGVPIRMEVRERGDEGRTRDNLDDPTCGQHFTSICRALAGRIAAERASARPLPTL